MLQIRPESPHPDSDNTVVLPSLGWVTTAPRKPAGPAPLTPPIAHDQQAPGTRRFIATRMRRAMNQAVLGRSGTSVRFPELSPLLIRGNTC
jgi:hypothetical protein